MIENFGFIEGTAIVLGIILMDVFIKQAIHFLGKLIDDKFNKRTTEYFWVYGAINSIMILIFIFLVMNLLFNESPETFGFNLKNWQISLGYILFFGAFYAGAIIYSMYHAYKQNLLQEVVPTELKWTSPKHLYGFIVEIALFVGVVEEGVYRGLVQTILDNTVGYSTNINLIAVNVRVSTIVAALLFVLVHLVNVIVKFESMRDFKKQLPGRLIISFLLSWIYQDTGSLLAPIIIHTIIDLTTVASFAYFREKSRRRHVQEYKERITSEAIIIQVKKDDVEKIALEENMINSTGYWQAPESTNKIFEEGSADDKKEEQGN